MKPRKSVGAEKKPPAEEKVSGAGTGNLSRAQREALDKELERTGVALDTVLKRYNIQSTMQMDAEIYGKAMKSLKNSKSRSVA